MKEIKLRIGDSLMEQIKETANQSGVSANTLITNTLEEIFLGQRAFNDDQIFKEILEEIQDREPGEFTLSDIKAFTQIGVSTAEKGYLQPSTVRARVGKAFNQAVSQGRVPGVTRAKDEHNELKFISRTAVYKKETGK